ncbi:MAG: 3-oxoacyl-ACP reductase [Propionibacteriales bacterium]|nr:3-oxoacyl-ACP reductase [Propionibacteriales bacterium]
MSDRYQFLAHTPIGQFVVKNLGLPNPPTLERYAEGQPVVDGTVLVGAAPGGRIAEAAAATLEQLGVEVAESAAEGDRFKGLVFDASGIKTSADLVAVQEFFTPVVRSLRGCGRVVVLATPPELAADAGERVAQRALEGFTRSLGKEVGRGSTVQLVHVAPGAETAITSTLAFLLSPKSAYVSAQVVRIGATGTTQAEPLTDSAQPLSGKVALVTGASRGIGESIARTLARDGATVVGVDVPPMASELAALMTELGGESVTVDITSIDAPQRIAKHVADKHDGVDIVVHNAGITRDKKLANMKADGWRSTIAVNLTAPERITAELLEQKLVRDNGRIIGVASIAGIAGNLGQTNYGTSKAGVIGLVDALAPTLHNGVTVNAVAPGFIETQMTAKIPLVIREAGRRMNSLSQGGLPIDVAETIAWFASPASTAVNGNVVRVCGQSLLGA